jgi:hypothetical protein
MISYEIDFLGFKKTNFSHWFKPTNYVRLSGVEAIAQVNSKNIKSKRTCQAKSSRLIIKEE